MLKSSHRATIAITSAALAAALTFAPHAMAQARSGGAQELDASYESAMATYSIQRFEDAYRSLSALADFGHAEAARVALFMHRFGKALYGSELVALPAQREAWIRLAAGEVQRPSIALAPR